MLKRSWKVLTDYALPQCPSCCAMDKHVVAKKHALNTEAFRQGIYSSVFKPPQQHFMLWGLLQDHHRRFLKSHSSIVCPVLQPESVQSRKVAASTCHLKIECSISVIAVRCIKYCCTVWQWIAGYDAHLLTWRKYKSLKNQVMNAKHFELSWTFMIQ